jgi:hypothetical protein
MSRTEWIQISRLRGVTATAIASDVRGFRALRVSRRLAQCARAEREAGLGGGGLRLGPEAADAGLARASRAVADDAGHDVPACAH